MTRPVPFTSLRPGADAPDVRAAIARVIDRGWFVLGPEVEAFEHEFAAASGAGFAVGVGTGTDAIALILRGLGVGPGDEVITTSLSATFTALAIVMAGATPVFADISADRLTLDPEVVAALVSPRTAAILPVHLYGQAADMPALETVARRHGLALVEDACQAHLATADGRAVGTIGVAGAFSFYPTKNLGALGDAGAVVTNDAGLAARIARLRNGGQRDRYAHVEAGVNSRLDELQAAVLRVRLPHLPAWTARRKSIAAAYRTGLANTAITVPPVLDQGHVHHLFPVLAGDRDGLRTHLDAHGIGTLVHYPIPIPRQPAFSGLPAVRCPTADRVADAICSLPLHPGLSDADVGAVIEAVRAWRGGPFR